LDKKVHLEERKKLFNEQNVENLRKNELLPVVAGFK
jgi:hypothetical protein